MFDVRDLRATVVPKSDQLNTDQLLSGPMTITVTDVRVTDSAEQPVTIHYAGEDGRPYKPCKTMRKVLIFAWGQDGSQWHGRAMTLYNDPSIKFGGQSVGGIRISHLSDIERDVQVSLAVTKGKKAQHVIKVMQQQPAAAKSADTVKDKAARIATRVAAGEAADVVAAMLGMRKPALDALWQALDPATTEALKAAWPQESVA